MPASAARPRACDSTPANATRVIRRSPPVIQCPTVTDPSSSETIRLTREGDLVHLQVRGPLDLEQTNVMLEQVARVLREVGRAYLLADMSQLEGILPEARRAVSEFNKTHRVTGCALYGANFATRTLTSLLYQAVRLVGNKHFELEFARDEAAGRRWIDAHRARCSAGGPHVDG